ncbi:hypothetical protein [Streptomyces sp. NPDC029526]
MNLTHAVVAVASAAAPAGCEDLVVEELVWQNAEQAQPGTCICWIDVYSD